MPRRQNGSALSICSSTRPSWRGELTAYSKISKSVSLPRPYFAFSLPSSFFISYKPTIPALYHYFWPRPCCHTSISLRTPFPPVRYPILTPVSRRPCCTCTGRNHHPTSTGESQPWYCHVGPWVQIQALEDEWSSSNLDSEEQWRELQYQYQ